MAIPSLAMIPSGYKDGKVYSVLPTNGDGDFTFSRGSNATRVNKDGLIEEITGQDTPRLDYSDSSCPSLLLEPQSTNLIEYSEDFTQGWTENNSTVTNNQVISPDGTLNADKITKTSGDGGVVYSKSINGTYTVSSYIKADVSSWSLLYINFSGGTDGQVFFDLENGVIGNEVSADGFIENVGNGWYRCGATFTTPANLSDFRIFPSEPNSTTATNGSIYVWGVQLEEQSYPTSYIPTNGVIATRLADECVNTSAGSVIGQIEGTMFIEAENNPIAYLLNSPNNVIFGSINSGNYLNNFHFTTDSSNIYVYCNSGGALQAVIGTSLPSSSILKMAVTYTSSEIKFFVNGVLVGTDTSLNLPIGMNQIDVGYMGQQPATQKMRGGINNFILFDKEITEAEAIALTS